jgi:hypothetical protein
MSGFDDFNFPAFFAAEAVLKAEGHEIFNPAQKDIDEWGDLETVKAKANYRDCMRKDLNCLLDWAEGIALLPGWEKSKGATIEKLLAEALKLEVRYL